MALKYQRQVCMNWQEVLDEIKRLMDGTENFTPVIHMLVNEDNNVVAMNIGGPTAEVMFNKIANAPYFK